MISSMMLIQPLGDCRDKALVGGKAVNLGTLIRAGFAVPEGIVITTDAYSAWVESGSQEIPEDLKNQILRAYRGMGAAPPAVAVRSSATAEDLAQASMAGQYETFLDVRDEEALLTRVRLCWASLDSPRTRAYLKEHGIDIATVAMAVVVQRLVPAEVAGVLFTANPQTGSKSEMLVEASWGLGEAVVSGRVQPDVLRIDRATGRVVDARIADKQVMIPPGRDAHEEVPVEAERRRVPCLKSGDVQQLWKLGVKAAEHFSGPQDVEWALFEGKVYLLQSRPITTLEDAENYEQLLQSTRAGLRELLEKGRGPWVVHNLAETLPHPTPLTWSVIRRFMSGAGGFGAMYRRAGFEPSERVCREGFLTLIAGRIYMDASLCPEMFFEGYPFKYDLEELRRNPDAAQNPPTVASGGLAARMRMSRRAGRGGRRVRELADDVDRRLASAVIPEFVKWVREEKGRELASLSNDELVALWQAREKRVMDEFAPESLLPSLISATALAELRGFLGECFWDQDADALANLLSSGHDADKTLQANAQLYELSQGEETLDAWLAEYGHRAPEEFDLASPRWRERREELGQLARRLRDGPNPADLHAQHREKVGRTLEELKEKLPAGDRAELERLVNLARRYMPWREDGKYYLMLGYELLRDVAREAGQRLEVGGDIFLLTTEEMFDALKVGFAPQHLIAQRKALRKAESRVRLGHVIEAGNVEGLGTSHGAALAGEARLEGFGISPGTASGPVRIVTSPTEALNLGKGYVLVCGSTDPSWTPLFANAAGLVLERGGTLSHGAVVAREMSIPAVVLREATTVLSDGEMVMVDGGTGVVMRVSGERDSIGEQLGPSALTPALSRMERERGKSPSPRPSPTGGERTLAREGQRSPAGEGEEAPLREALSYQRLIPSDVAISDTTISRERLPPPAGRKDRRGRRLRNWAFGVWSVYLVMLFVLPQSWLYQPSIAVLDFFLWPLVRAFGKPGAVAVIAAGLAALTMVGQKYLTDNGRLLVAKRRAGALGKEAAGLPADSARAMALRRAAGAVHGRVVGASFVPLAVLLGPMVMIFLWLPMRVDPASWSPAPGTAVKVVAMVQTDDGQEILLEAPAPLRVDAQTPTVRKPPPIRRTLEAYRSKLKPSDLSNVPWELKEVAEQARREKVAELDAYLAGRIPAVPMEWVVLTPKEVSGRWGVKVRTGREQVMIDVTVGDRRAPGVLEVVNDGSGAIESVKVVYPPPPRKVTFFAPLGFLGRSTISYWDVGWLGAYLLAYIPTMFVLRWVLRIA